MSSRQVRTEQTPRGDDMRFRVVRERCDNARRLTKHEIDRRIEAALSEVASLCDDAARADGDLFRPRWIAPGELIRRLQPFVGRN